MTVLAPPPERTVQEQSQARRALLVVGAAGSCVLLAVLVAAAAVGALPWLVPFVLIAVVAGPPLVVRPTACLVVAVVVEAANLSGVAADRGVPGVHLLVLALAAAAAARSSIRGEVRPAWSPVLLFALILLAAQWLAATSAHDQGLAAAAVLDTLRHLVWLVVLMLLLVARPHAVRAAARALTLTLAALCLLIVLQEFALDNASTFGGLANVPLGQDVGAATARHAGPQSDVNFWGRVLVLALPFALSCLPTARTVLHRAAWALISCALAAGIVLTGSRGALLAAAVAVVCWALLTGGRYAQALLLSPLVAGLAVFVPGVGSRLATLSLLGAGSGLEGGDPSLQGRVVAQTVALRIVQDYPVLGIGPGNFLDVMPEYLRLLALRSLPLAPHNQYLEAAAESGIVGLCAWLLFLGSAAYAALRVRLVLRAAQGSSTADDLSMANAVLAALLGWAVASLFLHLATFRTLLLVVGIGAALELKTRGVWGAGPLHPSARPVVVERSGSSRARFASLIGALLALTLTTWEYSRPSATTWQATASAKLVVGPRGDTGSYTLDALGRDSLVRTFASLMADPRFRDEGAASVGLSGVEDADLSVRVRNATPSGVILVTASAPTSAQAVALSTAVRDVGVRYVQALDPLYTLTPLSTGPVAVRPEARDQRGVLVVGTALTLLGLFGWWTGRDRPDVVAARTALSA